MAARQEHGFKYQEKIIQEKKLRKELKHTHKFDAYEKIKGIEYSVSIKCIKLGSGIDFGDFERQSKVDKDFILYIGFWEGNTNNIVKEYKILIKKEKWNSYFGDLSIITNLKNDLKNISNEKKDDGIWKTYRTKYKKLYGKSTITLKFKRDHKTQKRIQCGISKTNFNKILLEENIIISK